MRLILVIIAFALLAHIASGQVVLEMTQPQVINVTLRESSEGILCNAHTSEGSWPSFNWLVNGKAQMATSALLNSGYRPGDLVSCRVSATTGSLSDTMESSIIAQQESPSPLTGAIVGASEGSTPFSWVFALLLAIVLAGLVVANVRLWKSR